MFVLPCEHHALSSLVLGVTESASAIVSRWIQLSEVALGESPQYPREGEAL